MQRLYRPNAQTQKTTWIHKMQIRWRVGPWGVLAILVVFSLTGITVVWLKSPILGAILPADAPRWVRWTTYALIIFPLYEALLIGYGTLFGQFRFFWAKQKAMVRGVGRLLRLCQSLRP